ncbi:MAG: hypothetical protein LBM27_05125 [Lactobacillaceae bacterium]|jgi:hypothetical protein|nr:hypothetical protein [Lactobacillaceae bacterium]
MKKDKKLIDISKAEPYNPEMIVGQVKYYLAATIISVLLGLWIAYVYSPVPFRLIKNSYFLFMGFDVVMLLLNLIEFFRMTRNKISGFSYWMFFSRNMVMVSALEFYWILELPRTFIQVLMGYGIVMLIYIIFSGVGAIITKISKICGLLYLIPMFSLPVLGVIGMIVFDDTFLGHLGLLFVFGMGGFLAAMEFIRVIATEREIKDEIDSNKIQKITDQKA